MLFSLFLFHSSEIQQKEYSLIPPLETTEIGEIGNWTIQGTATNIEMPSIWETDAEALRETIKIAVDWNEILENVVPMLKETNYFPETLSMVFEPRFSHSIYGQTQNLLVYSSTELMSFQAITTLYLNVLTSTLNDPSSALSNPDFYTVTNNCLDGILMSKEITDTLNAEYQAMISDDSEQYNVVLNMISTSKTPDTTSTYSSISMSYGIIKYSYINTTYNKATCDPSLYVLCSSGTNALASGSFVHISNCFAQGEVYFNSIKRHEIRNMNVINCTTVVSNNAVIRSWGSNTMITRGIFLENKGNLFITRQQSGIITLIECFFPSDYKSIGSGSVLGTAIENSQINNISFDKCEIVSICSQAKKNISFLLSLLGLKQYLFLFLYQN